MRLWAFRFSDLLTIDEYLGMGGSNIAELEFDEDLFRFIPG